MAKLEVVAETEIDSVWRQLRASAEAAAVRGMTRAQLIAAIDHARPPEVGLATAIRLFLLAEARAGRLERPREGD